MTAPMPDPISHAEMIAALNDAIEAAEMEAQGYRNGASISDGDERLLREAEEYQRRADTLRAVLRLLDRTQPTDTQADLTERARAVLRAAQKMHLEEPLGGRNLTECEVAAIAAALQSEREAAAAEARRAAIQIARREHEEHIAARDDALAAGNEMGALTRARQAQTASEIARAIRALASPAAPQEDKR